MNAIALVIAVLMIGIGVMNLSAFLREGLAILILLGGVAAWANSSASWHAGEGLAAFLALFFLSMLVWKPRVMRVILWPLKEFFLGFFVAKGVKASGVLKPFNPPALDAQPSQDFIYVIKGDNMVKVGVSTNPRARCLALQTGSAYPLEIVFAAPVRNAYAVESLAHDLLGSTRIRISGEWFGCSSETAIAAIRRAPIRSGCRSLRRETFPAHDLHELFSPMWIT